MNKKNIIHILIFLTIFVIVISYVEDIFRTKEAADTIYTFKEEEKNSLDVLFIGASTCYRFFSPQELWNSYGITSYNMGTSEQSLAESYFVLKYALDDQSPQLVVMDVSSMIIHPLPLSDARTHHILDNLEINKIWFEACMELVSQDKRIDFLIPMICYHERWKELNEKDFKPIVSYSKGTMYNYVIQSFEKIILADPAYMYGIKDESLEWLNKINTLCRENEIQLLFTINPIPKLSASEEEGEVLQGMHHTLEKLAESEAFDVLNMTGDCNKIGIDMKMDYSDGWHVNVAGAMKITKYLGNYLIDKYNLNDHRNEKISELWNERYQGYSKDILQKISHSNVTEEQKEYFVRIFNENKQ